MDWAIDKVERGWFPDSMIRFGIRRLLKRRLKEEGRDGSARARLEAKMALVDHLREEPIAVLTDKANEQHYEMPARLHGERSSAPWLKYSGLLLA